MFRPWRLRGGAAAGSDGFRPLVVGIVNATPDSFFDGGNHPDAESAAAHGLKLWEEGADLIDVGGESTRPGADPVDGREAIRRAVAATSAKLWRTAFPNPTPGSRARASGESPAAFQRSTAPCRKAATSHTTSR